MPGLLPAVVHQQNLLHHLRTIFPEHQTLVNARKELNIKYPESGNYAEYDVSIPGINLCFEFQDAHHYIPTWYNNKAPSTIEQKDSIKQLLTVQNGMSLIIIPCWWDGALQSMLATISFERPDLTLKKHPKCITLNPPSSFFPNLPNGVEQMMLASFPSEFRFVETVATHEWWLGEKYDGVRCSWNPTYNALFSRNGNVLQVLPQILSLLPSSPVDSELWFGRSQFNDTKILAVKDADENRWNFMRVLSFDSVLRGLRGVPFEQRYKMLLDNISETHPYMIVAPRILCEGSSHLEHMIQGVIENEGEGLVLRKLNSLYEPGRSSNLLKLKTSMGDMEAIVVSTSANGVELKTPSGNTFIVPPNDVLIPFPAIGDVVTFSFEALNRGFAPANPKIFRIRTDVAWEDVIRNSVLDNKSLNESSDVVRFHTKTPGRKKSTEMRLFMERFAQNKNLDPLVPSTWYKLYDSVIGSKRGRKILRKFKGGYIQAVRHLFPDLEFDHSAFQQPLWSEVATRRKFFENFAYRNKFDPLEPENWYKQTRKTIVSTKGAGGVIGYHNCSVSQALLDLFPDIGLEKQKLRLTVMWHEPQMRRKFFEDYAATNNFDPLHPENWYTLSEDKFLSTKGGVRVIWYHDNSIEQALYDLFPDVPFKKQLMKLQKQTSSTKLETWEDAAKRRKFFEAYAREHNFSPVVPDHWYLQTRQQILAAKGARTVMWYHDSSISQALTELFPDVPFVKSNFQFSHYLWRKSENRRIFFEKYATENKFDPLVAEKWYSEPLERILEAEEVRAVLSYHGNSVVKALLDLFSDIGLDKSKFTQTLWSDSRKRKKFFEDFAASMGLNPRNPETWYSISRNKILARKGASSAIAYHNNSVSKALLDLFPDIGLVKAKFQFHQSVWRDENNRRKFFEEFAKVNSFDPLSATSWYQQPRERFVSTRGVNSVLLYYNESIPDALITLFPEVAFEKSSFHVSHKALWRESSNRRKFFENFAKDNRFDPLRPPNWYNLSKHTFMLIKGASTVLSYHSDSVGQALLDLFPEIGLDKSLFKFKHHLWRVVQNRRKYFEDYAKAHGFDPLNPAAWYAHPRDNILAAEEAKAVLSYHGNNTQRALMELFPDIGLVKTKFKK